VNKSVISAVRESENGMPAAEVAVNMRLALIISAVSLLFPWRMRRWLLQVVCKYSIDRDARIGLSLIGCPSLRMAPASRIGHFCVIKGSDVEMGAHASIGDFNWVSGLPLQNDRHFRTEIDRHPTFKLDRHAAVTSRHFVDCSNSVHIGEFSIVAGARSQILTHAIDYKAGRQVSAPVRIGRYCFVGTGCIVLKGARLPDCSILAAGSCLARSFDEPLSLYSGVPATRVKALDPDAAYFHRQHGFVD